MAPDSVAHKSLNKQAFLSGLIVLVLSASGCAHNNPDNLPVAQDHTTIKQAYAGDDIQLLLTMHDPSLAKASKVEVTFDDAVQTTLQDEQIVSAKEELKPDIRGDALTLTLPTTTDFRPGIWHLSLLRFYLPATKHWVEFKEGQDFNSMPIKIVNLSEPSPTSPKIEFSGIESKHPQ
jgi:hypothetical protein